MGRSPLAVLGMVGLLGVMAFLYGCGGGGGGGGGGTAAAYVPAVLYATNDSGEYYLRLFTAAADGSDTRQVAAAPSGQLLDEWAISPDRSRVFYMQERAAATGLYDLYTVRSDGTDTVKVSGTMPAGSSVQGGLHWSPDSTRIAYPADIDAPGVHYDLYTVRADGTGRVKINPTLQGLTYSGSVWSPDGSKILYTTDETVSGKAELHVSNPEGTIKQRISGWGVTGTEVTRFNWAPDGSRVAYTANQDNAGLYEMYTTLPDGTGFFKVSGDVGSGLGLWVEMPAWAPNSLRVGYTVGASGSGANVFYSCPPDSAGGCVQLNGALTTAGTGGNVTNPAWSPSGTRFAYRADQDVDQQFELYVSPADTAVGNTKVSGTLATGGDVGGFQWAPDGQSIVYNAVQTAPGVDELFLSTVSPATNIKLAATSPTNYRWAPDGSRIAYLANPDTAGVYELYTVKPDGTGAVKVSGTLADGDDVIDFAWTADSTRLIYVAGLPTPGLSELYSAKPDGTGSVKISAPLQAGEAIKYFIMAP